MSILKYVTAVAIILLVVGGLNWGSVGLFDHNFVAAIFGDGTMTTKVIYDAVGLAAIYVAIKKLMKLGK